MNKVLEIVCWRAADGVTDSIMIQAVNDMIPDLRGTAGFIEQTLYKKEDGLWVDVYYWESAESAHASNDAMADKASLKNLLALIDLETVTIEVHEPLQNS